MAGTGNKAGLGLPACIALVVGNMIGSGVFLLPSSLAQFGPISIGGWLVTSTGAIMLALVFGRLARQVPKTGGPLCLYSLWAIYGAGADVVYYGFLLLLAGVPVFVGIKWRQPVTLASSQGQASG
jgi:amino acid transporter